MRKTVILLLIMLCGSLALQAQSVDNIRSEYKSEYGYYEIKYDLDGNTNDFYFVILTASLDSKTHKGLKTLTGQGAKGVIRPSRNLSLFWHPQMEGFSSGDWKFSIDIKKLIMNENMVHIEGGTFMMGSNDGDYDEKPIHEVTLSSFWISKYQVTQKEWQEVMGNNPSRFKGDNLPLFLKSRENLNVGNNPSRFKGDNLPVEQVSWGEAIEYCNKRSIKEGLTPCYSGKGDNITCNWNADGYRLPTEAEWEYAARGGNKSRGYIYAGSNILGDVAWHEGNSEKKTHPVGQKKPNELGIYDMSGNVCEWCWDWHDRSYYEKSPKKDPRGATRGLNKILRGSSWCSRDFKYYRISHRFVPTFFFECYGLRVVRAISH